MAATTLSLAPSNATSTLFRAWGSAISAFLATAGWVQTADTGQVNWTTITAPAINLTTGYEIWRMNDALQSTSPVFLRVEYGTSGVSGQPAIAFTLGSGSNGSGTLTGVTSTRVVLGCASNSATPSACYLSGGTNRLYLAMWAGGGVASSLVLHLSIERSVDVAGAVTGEAVLCCWRSPSVGTWNQIAWNCTTGPVTAVETSLGCFGPSVGSGTSGASTAVYPIYLTKGIFFFPGLNALGGFEANFTPGTTTAVTYYGASHTYMPLTNSLSGDPVARAVGSTSNLLVRYE